VEYPPKFKVGDLIILNDFGLLIYDDGHKLGLVMTSAYSYVMPRESEEIIHLEYWTYDIMIGGELVKMMPEEFLRRIKNEEDIEGVEDFFDRKPSDSTKPV